MPPPPCAANYNRSFLYAKLIRPVYYIFDVRNISAIYPVNSRDFHDPNFKITLLGDMRHATRFYTWFHRKNIIDV